MPTFNKQNASSFGAMGHEAYRAKRKAQQDREALLQRLLKAEETRIAESAQRPPQLPADSPDDFVARKLERVRLQWGKLDVMLDEALDKSPLDAGAVDRIAAAICRVAELERTLANRPLPGSRRPSADRSKPSFSFTPPVDS